MLPGPSVLASRAPEPPWAFAPEPSPPLPVLPPPELDEPPWPFDASADASPPSPLICFELSLEPHATATDTATASAILLRLRIMVVNHRRCSFTEQPNRARGLAMRLAVVGATTRDRERFLNRPIFRSQHRRRRSRPNSAGVRSRNLRASEGPPVRRVSPLFSLMSRPSRLSQRPPVPSKRPRAM